jgi:predicted Holliday junction resolvase-like endonuclease
MTYFFDRIKAILFIAALVGLALLSIYLVSVKSDLAIAKVDLEAAVGREKVLTEANAVLTDDLRTKETVNSALSLKLAVIEETYIADLEDLNEQIEDMKKDRKNSTVIVNKISYIKETYVEKATETVLGKMWESYCNQNGACQHEK